jgi:hypothetical protein
VITLLRKHGFEILAIGTLLVGIVYTIASVPLSSLWVQSQANRVIFPLSSSSPDVTFCIAVLSIIVLLSVVVVAFQRGIRRSIGFVLMAFGGTFLLWVATLLMTYNTLMLRQTQTFNHHLYYRAMLQTHDSIYHIRSTLVFQCDSLGIICQKVYGSERYQGSYSEIDEITANAVLFIDTKTNHLFLNIHDQQVLIA